MATNNRTSGRAHFQDGPFDPQPLAGMARAAMPAMPNGAVPIAYYPEGPHYILRQEADGRWCLYQHDPAGTKTADSEHGRLVAINEANRRFWDRTNTSRKPTAVPGRA